MRYVLLIPILAACSIYSLHAFYSAPLSVKDSDPLLAPGSGAHAVAHSLLPEPEGSASHSQLAELLVSIESYEDIDYGFNVAVPTGWSQIANMEAGYDPMALEPGYSVGFESPSQGENDYFADYIMIEILPGAISGSFETDGGSRYSVSIDGKPAWIDKLNLKGGGAGINDLDLLVYQAEITGLGYTVGLYAIGEPSREALLSAAFEVMVRTIRFTADPFSTV